MAERDTPRKPMGGYGTTQETLTPLQAVGEFVLFCDAMTALGEQAMQANLSQRDGNRLVHADNMTLSLHLLLSTLYAGTPTEKTHLLTNGFKNFGGGVPTGYFHSDDSRARYTEQTPYSEWPKRLGMDLESEHLGVFSQKGAQIYESDFLAFRIIQQTDLLHNGRVTTEGLVDVLTQLDEYTRVFGQPLKEVNPGIKARIERFTKDAKRYVKDHPFKYERDPIKQARELAKIKGHLGPKYKFYAKHHNELLEESEGRYVLIYNVDGQIVALEETFISSMEVMYTADEYLGRNTPYLSKHVARYCQPPLDLTQSSYFI